MKFLIPAYILLFNLQVSAQNNLHVMFSKNPLPEWINTSPEKNLSNTKATKAQLGWKMNSSVNEVLAQANDAQYSYLQRGRLLFNDEAGVLANKIADRLLENDHELRKSLNICVYYSSGTDISSYPNGFIVIELGVFAQMENEDQLAFLIAHEIAHIKNGDVAISESNWKPETWNAQVEKYINYIRERERVADIDAYQMYKSAGYSRLQPLRALEVMERNWIVPGALPFTTLLFTDAQFSYPPAFDAAADSCSLGYGESDFTNSAHEHHSARRSNLAKEYDLDTTGSEVIPMTSEFFRVNQLAIYNCGLISLEANDLAAALYMGYYIYMTDSSQRNDAGMLMTKAIYLYSAIASPESEFKNTAESELIQRPEKFGDLFFWANNEIPEEDLRGHILGVQVFFNSLTALEKMILSVRWCWEYSQQSLTHKQLAKELAANSVSILNYRIEKPVDSLATIRVIGRKYRSNPDNEEDDDDSSPLSEDKIKELKRRYRVVDSEIDRMIDSLKRVRDSRSSDNAADAGADVLISVNTQLATHVRDSGFQTFYTLYSVRDSSDHLADKPRAEHLLADSVYFITSNHIWCRETGRTGRFHVKQNKTEKKSLQIRKNIQLAGRTSRVKLLSASPVEPDTVSLDDYNQFALACRVFNELQEYDEQKYTYPIAYKEEFDSIVRKTRITHMITDLAVTRQFTKVRQPGWFVLGVLFPYSSPFVILWVLPPRKFTYRQTAIYNLQTGNLDWTWIQTGKGSGGPQQANPYYSKVFRKIKKPKSVKVPAGQVK